MNKIVLAGSGGLLAVSAAVFFAPPPFNLLSPAAAAGAWVWALFGPRRRPAPESRTVAAAVPPPPPPPRVEVREVVPGALSADLQRYRAGLDVLKGLKSLVVTDTEAAVLRLTEALFTLVGNSKEVSSHIEKSLGFLTDGDSGLRRTVGNLEQQVRVFESLASHFSGFRTELGTDIAALTQTVGSINEFSETLSDLADQTNVLAINASIEAARVGVHGRGFAVIAGHVQSLARNSKDISEKMARTVREVVADVQSSFARQTDRIREADSLIVRSEVELRRWADHVGPQLNEVEAMIADSRRLAELVTSELNDVTVSLQFQDRTKQILDHMAQVLDDSARRVVDAAGLAGQPVPPGLRDEAYADASRHFTVQEEWTAVPGRSPAPGPRSVELF